MENKTVVISVRIPKGVKLALEELADKKKVRVGDMIREWIKEEIDLQNWQLSKLK